MGERENDILLWEHFRQGRKDALAELFCKYFAELFKYGCKFSDDTEMLKDTIQELFLDLWHQKAPPPVNSIKAYLIKALKYKLLKVVAKAKKTGSLDGQLNTSFEISHESFLISSEEDKRKVLQLIAALEKLPNRQREIIYLKYYLNLSYDEICDIMQIQYQVARNQISQAIKTLKQIVGEGLLVWALLQVRLA
ncbi:RNA polymerase sigma factor [Parasediminibacterium sp. JCM 36343]|uniref:RNA polymerase sigma factor n=1 Tax=Parasediminibacterium sp. JCM 36343 TaxID=3374279 RepID=UPI00397D56C4